MPNSIQPIQKESVQRIVAGQAILDLASCVKELVDNALDAGSKSINIRLFGKGLDIVEVSDDGSGVPKASRDKLAVPYATSKITEFDDIYKTHSLGFRGEALYSLANLSQKLIIATRTADEAMAEKLEFQHDGTIDATVGATEMPRKVGTTVAVVKLLHQLPVRRRDLELRIAIHRSKLVQLVMAYAIFRTGVRIHLMDVDVKSGKENTIVASSFQNKTFSQTVSSVLGPKFLAGMTTFSVDLSSVFDDEGHDNDGALAWKVEGLISTASGKSVTKAGQQLYAIHQRPVELPKLTRILKSSFQLYQDKSPSMILNFIVPHHSYDINISPDKRTVLLTREEAIIERIQCVAAELWANQVDGTFQPRRRYAFVHDPTRAVVKEQEEETKRSQFAKQGQKPVDQEDGRNVAHSDTSGNDEPHVVKLPEVDEVDDTPETDTTKIRRSKGATAPADSMLESTWTEKQKWREAKMKFNRPDKSDVEALSTTRAIENPPKRTIGLHRFGFVKAGKGEAAIPTHKRKHVDIPLESRMSSKRLQVEKPTPSTRLPEGSTSDAEALVITPCSVESPTSQQQPVLQIEQASIHSPQRPEESSDEPPTILKESQSVLEESSVNAEDVKKHECEWTHFGTTKDVVSAYQLQRQAIASRKEELKCQNAQEQQAGAREEGSIKLRKEEFKNMVVIGQFNLGFILAKDSMGNLWILDQHACDERCNFEKLCLETRIQEQTLMKPLVIELSSLQEACIQDNLDVFQTNGFRFQYDESKPPGKRFALTALPYSGAQHGRNSVQYGRDDVMALCALLLGEEVDGGTGTDGNGLYGNNAIRRYASSSQQSQVDNIMARLPKTIAMFASRACRTSIMIGTALSEREMENLVHRLSAVDQPWNCPHGRPTLQHVGILPSVFLEDEKQQEFLIAEPTVTVLSQDEEMP